MNKSAAVNPDAAVFAEQFTSNKRVRPAITRT